MNAALRRFFSGRTRLYPWRGERDAYRVLVSEVMLQQTQASRVVPAYLAFVERFPTVDALANAPRADVVRQWGGLGYNRRAVALSEAARAIVREHAGVVPSDPSLLERLPGVGRYTAHAVASIAFGLAVPAIDTNVRRVVARARLGVEEAGREDVELAARRWIDRRAPGRWNQALMDVGRVHCRPVPRCAGCPLARSCRSRTSAHRQREGPARPRQRFQGSSRQLRGAIVRALRDRPGCTVGGLARLTGASSDALLAAIQGLVRDGLVRAGPAALVGRPGGHVRLA